jgi:hypothetical protein
MNRKTTAVLFVISLLACVATVLTVQAQVSDLGGSSPGLEDRATIGTPDGHHDDDDETCEAPDDGLVLDCLITQVTTDLDAPTPSATFWGAFCEGPTVTAGDRMGSFHPLLVLSSGPHHVTVDLAGFTDPATVSFAVECPCEECRSEVAIGSGPPGPTGEQGPTGPTGPTGPPGGGGAVCPCFDDSEIQGIGIDFMTQAFPDAACLDLLPDAIQLAGSRDGSGSGAGDPQAWIANVARPPELPQSQCLLVDNLYAINNPAPLITDEEFAACMEILLNSAMFTVNNCP